MKTTRAKCIVAGWLGLLSCLTGLRAQETPATVLEVRPKSFTYVASQGRTIFFSASPKDDANDPQTGFPLTGINFQMTLPTRLGTWEAPEFKVDYGGARFVLPARKIIVVAPLPKTQGMYAHVEVDPNGTGNVEVLLTVVWPNWPDKEKNIEFVTDFLPKGLKMEGNGGGWSHPDGGIIWNKSLVFHNGTGRPFILDTGYFENLPTNEGWPLIEIPPAN